MNGRNATGMGQAFPGEAQAGVAEPAAAPRALRPYPKLAKAKLKTRHVTGRILAYASPDSTYAVTKQLLDSAQHSIVIGIYDFSAGYMKAELEQAIKRAVRVSLMLDTNSTEESDLMKELSALGATCVKAPSASAHNPIAYFGNAHEKIIVVDDQIVMIQSGNWSENSIPLNEGDGVVSGGHFVAGNRDMGMAIESSELATFFAELVDRDMRLAQGLPIEAHAPAAAPAPLAEPSAAGEIFFEAAPPETPAQLFPSLVVKPAAPVPVTPAITPENFQTTAQKLLSTARRSIRIEQQYVRGGQPAVEQLLKEIAAVRTKHSDLDIRLIVSPKYLEGADREHFLAAMENYKLEFKTNYRFLSSRYFVHCHNKLIVVDEQKVLLGSQNWSSTGLLSNREASLLVEQGGIARYFGQIFDADWDMSEAEPIPPEGAPAAGAIAAPADLAKGGVRSTTADYAGV